MFWLSLGVGLLLGLLAYLLISALDRSFGKIEQEHSSRPHP
ncbi:hypothetical protein [Deinococcus roseus]|uniref:Uncharacterized protein n=1 Tax=Deinococcus roseus TaxID=392414 RepID=A0ABQ2CYB8_9DEIO|nr:hypothetical protein [Deinococcus roseus]GGJ25882.1 hypothetical protein GCM10008938_10000 [Deinococcus roseus]